MKVTSCSPVTLETLGVRIPPFAQLIKIERCGRMTKVNKTRARKEYNNGKKVGLMPCKVRIGIVQPVIVSNVHGVDFDTMVNNFEYYNCGGEMGKYAHFYIE